MKRSACPLLPALCLASCLFLSPSVASTDSQDPYERLIQMLRSSGDVIPPKLQGHPVANLYNREAIVPPQCYTRTEGYFNPCYVCHQEEIPDRENTMNDDDLQADYSFSDLGKTNHWKNLFEDRSERTASISDEEILAYINDDNYSELADRLVVSRFEGWIPDLDNLQEGAAAFDENGFARDGSAWVAYNYKPVPSTFWPTNGSTDDVMIRLPEPFRMTDANQYSRDVYIANLSILEANIKGATEIETLPIDEAVVGADLDSDGQLSIAHRINNLDTFVGMARDHYLEKHLYPQGTEFLHTVRYLGVESDGSIGPSRRIKEVRYMKKWQAYNKRIYQRRYQLEGFEKEAGNLPGYHNLGDWGLDNGTGWSVQGFIEGPHGRLRASTYEENLFCMGCHNSIGSTIDKTFSFARKIDGPLGWKYIDLKGMKDAPTLGEAQGEYLTYLERVGGGSEFRNNPEMAARWFTSDGQMDRAKVEAAADVYELVTPSVERALLLNKAYKTIVEDQDYIYGRDATVTPPRNVYSEIDNERTPTLPNDRIFPWNILLDWQHAPELSASNP
ncbi:hypothetical protein [Pelagicoccus sp. SDUM812003]|uniref:hypothetical protein n=1 Tax=Pelagicoccus sp. SDUM812003 TaxID=3041267 RepID=UPI00280D7FD5|nr:hypothetical protein [Pelagicoccus sp. SDUM812003]MDQ8201871.1 hypothetical protein [Pelagicoccus sp. SDUM812003]